MIPVRPSLLSVLVLLVAVCSSADAITPTAVPTVNQCNPSAHDCPAGKECICCCGGWVCMPPYLPCCALACADPSLPTPTPTPTPTCHLIAGLTDCQSNSDCVVVDQIDCCPCSSGGHQAAIRQSKQDELSQQLEVCCATAGACLPVYQCEQGLEAVCQSGMCTLVNPAGTPTPTPTPPAVVIGPGDFCEPDRICPAPLLCLIDPPHQALVCSCVGDCDGNADVTVDELITLVTIAVGTTGWAACPVGDANSDGQITVPEIVQAVNHGLFGCLTEPTPTPMVTPPVLHHGHLCCECGNAACVDFAWIEVERTCPAEDCTPFMDAECEAPCHGGPQGGPAVCVSLTPCKSDADCDDANGCTADRCTIDGCTHACVCD